MNMHSGEMLTCLHTDIMVLQLMAN